MIIKSRILFFLIFLLISSCADYSINQKTNKKEKKFFSSSGFALIYSDSLYEKKIISKKINNDKIIVMHNILKSNTSVKIINPVNSKSIDTKINRTMNYPKIFNLVISKKAAEVLDLDPENPYVEFLEIKKNKTFIAKKSNTFEEEKNVAEKAPVNEVKIDELNISSSKTKKKSFKDNNFIIIINDFYYEESAFNLKLELVKKTKFNNFFVKKINSNKYRLFIGPFKNFNTLKATYISLNNFGFDALNVYKD
jgi:hypothetical protein